MDESAFAPGTGNGNGIDSTDYDVWRANFGAGGGASGWLSFQDQDLEGSGLPGDGLGWEEGDSVDSTLLFEAILVGGYTVATDADLSLGNAFSPGGAETLTFEYHVAGTGATFTMGDVNYVSTASLESSAVPEPSTVVMALLTLVAGLCVSGRGMASRRQAVLSIMLGAATSIVAWAVLGSPAQAAVYNDRVYLFGDPDSALGLEGASNGAVIGSLNTSPLTPDLTIDSGPTLGNPSGTRLQLQQTGGAVYENVSATGLGLNRPGASSGDFGVRFDGRRRPISGHPSEPPRRDGRTSEYRFRHHLPNKLHQYCR